MSLVVLVTGSRKLRDRQLVFDMLDSLAPDEIIAGGADGADRLAEEWAKEAEVPCHRFPAKWKTGLRGKGEGAIRNQAMLGFLLERCPGMDKRLVAFPLAKSKGTWDMIGRCHKAHVPVHIVGSR